MEGARHIVSRHSGLIIFTLVLAAIVALLWLLRDILLPFLIGLLVAYILLPLVSWLEMRLPGKANWRTAKRIGAIVITYIIIIAIAATVGYYAVSSLAANFSAIVSNLGDYFSKASHMIDNLLSRLRSFLPAAEGQQITNFFNNLVQSLGAGLRNLFSGMLTAIPSSFIYIAGFVTLPIFLFYVLKDHERMNKGLYSWMSEDAANHTRNVLGIVREVLGRYLRAQIVLGLFVGTLAIVGLRIINVPFAIGLGVIAGVAELIPILGPWIGGVIAALVVLATDPAKVIWVIILFVAIQLVENALLVPRIHGRFLRIHPAAAIVLAIAGGAVAGLWGLVLAAPLASTIVKLYQYVGRTAAEQDKAEAI